MRWQFAHSASFYWLPWFNHTTDSYDWDCTLHDYWFGWLWWQGRCTTLEERL